MCSSDDICKFCIRDRFVWCVFFQAEDGIRDLVRSRGLGDVYKRQELINTTILKDVKKKTANLPTLNYLFQFLDAYDFASEGTEDIQEENKTIINASVLGKVFEKINGYKDGSIFTPAFITMYMCCLLYTSPSPRDRTRSRMPSSA